MAISTRPARWAMSSSAAVSLAPTSLPACQQGRLTEAHAHLVRAEELFAEQSGFLAFEFDAVRAELAVAAGDTERAFGAAMAGVSVDGAPPTFVERLIPLAARAAPDQAQRMRDRGEDPGRAVERLHDLQTCYPTVIEDSGPGPMYQAQLRALQAWYDAEVMRGLRDPNAGPAWIRAAQACAEGELAWDEAYAQWRAAEAFLQDRSARATAARALRRAHELHPRHRRRSRRSRREPSTWRRHHYGRRWRRWPAPPESR
jgi:hypothetical protein